MQPTHRQSGAAERGRSMFLRAGVVMLCLIGWASPGHAASDGRLWSWQLTADRVRGDSVLSEPDQLAARIEQPVTHGTAEPAALDCPGNAAARHRVLLAERADQFAGTGLPADSISVEAWVLVSKPQPWAGLVSAIRDTGSYERGWSLCLSGDGTRFCWGVASMDTHRVTYLDAAAPLVPGAWYHVVGTYEWAMVNGVSAGVQRLYVDGELVRESAEQSGPIAYQADAPVVAAVYQDDNDFITLTGQLETVSIAARAWTADDVAERFEARQQRFPGIAPAGASRQAGTQAGARVTSHDADDDWPTYMGSNRRTGLSGSAITATLRPAWTYRLDHPPVPSWPAPAKRDPYNNKPVLEPRVVFDRVSHVTGVAEDDGSGKLYLGTSADGRVVCLDLTTGQELWDFATEGPVRCAPTVVNDAIVFGSDDGRVYALDRHTGRQRWATPIAEADRRLAGNQRVISNWPIRTDVTVNAMGERSFGFVCAGLFPVEGVYNAIIDLADGSIVKRTRIDEPVQGYMIEINGELKAQTGRNPAGASIGRVEPVAKVAPDADTTVSITQDQIARARTKYPYAIIGTDTLRFAGGNGVVAALRPDTGAELWTAEVDGLAYGLSIVGRTLIVSTDRGMIYAFTDAAAPIGTGRGPALASGRPTVAPPTARRAVDAITGALPAKEEEARGYALLIGTDGGHAAAQLAERTGLSVIGLETDAARADAARAHLRAAGLADRVTIHLTTPGAIASGSLPYTPEMFNLVAVNDLDPTLDLPTLDREAIEPLVRPYGGIGMLSMADDTPAITKGIPDGAGSWTHTYGDPGNPGASNDRLVTGSLAMQWYGPPGPRNMVDRHQRAAPPLFSDGIMFIPGENYLYAVDAYNGTILWEREVPDMFRPAVFKNCGNLAVGPARDGRDAIYVASGRQCIAFDALTGEPLTTHLAGLQASDTFDWGYVGLAAPAGQQLVLGSVTVSDASRWEISGESWKIAYADGTEVVVSERLFANTIEGRRAWTHNPRRGTSPAVIINPTICHDGQLIHFIESASPAAIATDHGRPKLADVFAGPCSLVAIDLATGLEARRTPIDLTAYQHVIHMSVANGVVLVTGSKYAPKDPANPAAGQALYYDLRAHDARSGRELWRRDHPGARQVIGGIHGEQTDRPVIVESSRIHLDVMAYDLKTGDVLWKQQHTPVGGCGTMSAAVNLGFRRLGSPHMVDLKTGKATPITLSTRPGCWINIIPAGGLVMIPEASSGCSCNHAIQTSLVMRPK